MDPALKVARVGAEVGEGRQPACAWTPSRERPGERCSDLLFDALASVKDGLNSYQILHKNAERACLLLHCTIWMPQCTNGTLDRRTWGSAQEASQGGHRDLQYHWCKVENPMPRVQPKLVRAPGPKFRWSEVEFVNVAALVADSLASMTYLF